MRKIVNILLLVTAIVNCFCVNVESKQQIKVNLPIINKSEQQSNDNAAVIEIKDSVEGNENYKKAEFSAEASDLNHYFKYSVTTIPTSRVGAFRIEFDQWDDLAFEKYKVFCTFVDSSTSDDALISTLSLLTEKTSSCVGAFSQLAYYDGIIEYDQNKTKLGIYLVTAANLQYTARIYMRTTEKILGTTETKAQEDETYSLVPYTIIISEFRKLDKSKILFYSFTRELQMYYVETSLPYPEKLFSGNIMSVFTNPNMVRQKYHNADTMVLLTNAFGAMSMIGEQFKFEVRLFDSDFLLDYFVSSNSAGRPKNSPLLINMTDCSTPYYAILNYNQPEDEMKLHIDQIYGKISSISVASSLTQTTWDEMLEEDMESIDIIARQHTLAAQSKQHLDVYKIECVMPMLLNFYYVKESATLTDLDSGDVAIVSLKSYQSVNIPIKSTVILPEVMIDIYNPTESPIVIIDDGQNENVYKENTLVKTMPWTLSSGITIKERAGFSNTRIIVKIGYSTSGWEDVSENVKYNSQLNTYLFAFSNGADKLNYTYANLVTSGTNTEDNVKYCFTTNIGAALKPSAENCYRVSSNNSYTLKVYNPLILYKDYQYDDTYKYYVTFKPTQDGDKITVTPQLFKYDTNERNIEDAGNKLTIGDTQSVSTILTPPKNNDLTIFYQIQVCDETNSVTNKVINPIDQSVIAPVDTIGAGTKNYYRKIENNNYENELIIGGNKNVDVFVRHVGLPGTYQPSFKDFTVTFDDTKNQININVPFTTTEDMTYYVLVDKNGFFTNKAYTLCSFADVKIDSLASLVRTVDSSNMVTSVQINFKKINLNAGDLFEALVFAEQNSNSRMAFLSSIVKGTVGAIETETINEITDEYTLDPDYAYKTFTASLSDLTYYFSYLPSSTLDVPVGSLGIEVDASATGYFTSVDCAFVDDGTDAMSMVEAVEDVIEQGTSYCVGSRSTVNPTKYRYIFKYEYNGSTPKRLVIKVSNGGYVQGSFTVFVKKTDNTYIEQTDWTTLKEYGRDEEAKKSPIPYIVDLSVLRGESTTDYVSKVLFYSQHLEMQMYYLDDDAHAPILLFTGNIMLVYTKLTLAEQKYHSTKLVLLSENLSGQEHASLGDTFRFHTKMFKSDAQVEYFVSANSEGRTLNFPLSIEMNVCTAENNKFYYILNYNKAEDNRMIFLDMIFGKFKTARMVNEINAQKWDELIANNLVEITNYQANLSLKDQHMDVIEIECSTPLLLNVYYTDTTQNYQDLEDGDIAVINLSGSQTKTIDIDSSQIGHLYYSLSLFNPVEEPQATLSFSTGETHSFSGNTLSTGSLMSTPDYFTITNEKTTATRFIFKIGYNVETEWHEDTENIEGTLFTNDNMYVYRFPSGANYKNFTSVSILVNAVSNEENVKFCYSTNLGMAIKASQENCFRTGKYIPYELTFINPIIVSKNYVSSNDFYYVTFKPFTDGQYISLSFTENKYEVTERNDEGEAKILTLKNSRAASILSLPQTETTTILVHLKTCTYSTEPIAFVNRNAFTEEQTNSGKVYYTDKSGVYYLTTNTELENELELTGGSNVEVYTKHAAIGNYQVNIQDYKATFYKSKNTVIIVKPIFGEEFTFTVIVGKKNTLSAITICKLASMDKSKYGDFSDYHSVFDSVSSDSVIHYIEFSYFGYDEDTEFDLLVYAEQKNNAKMNFIYPVISGVVGQVEGVIDIDDAIPDEPDYITKEFPYESSSNYAFYDFKTAPYGGIASLKVITPNIKVSKVGCAFVEKDASDFIMVGKVNEAIRMGTSACVGETKEDSDGFDAIIKANYTGDESRLVIQIIYANTEEQPVNKNKLKLKLKEEEDIQTISVNIRISGVDLGVNEGKFGGDENYAAIPYVIDLLKVREQYIAHTDYVSKVLFYSNTREMQMFFIKEDSPAPVELFSGNIMLAYTNEDLIKEKYYGATKMILLTDSLSATERHILGEEYRFRVRYFNSAKNINYFVSGNANGRLLNNPTAIEMVSCDQPYYYIMNYNVPEEQQVKLYIDNVFGEVSTIKLATSLNAEDWDSLISAMEPISGDQIVLEQSSFHIDVIEVTCKLPLLLNVYYANPNEPKTTSLEIGDMSIFSLSPSQTMKLTFKQGQSGPFVYSFSFYKEGTPNVQVTFEDETTLEANQNGVYIKDSLMNYNSLEIKNREISGSATTRVIFKFGYVIESTFAKIQNDMYNNYNNPNRTANLFGYKFETNEQRLNYTSVDFLVSTTEDNVKFCYSTNLGAYVDPSFQNCNRVGKANSYTISVLNPLVMYREYHDDQINNYYVGFRTVNLNQNITITPTVNKYPTTERNLEGAKNKITTGDDGKYSTILTAPENHEDFIFVHVHVCTKKAGVYYSYLNAYDQSNLGYDGEIQANTNNNFRTIENTKLDTELSLTAASKGVEIFVKHVGITQRYQPLVKDIEINYNKNTHVVNFTQPINGQEFKYTVYIDKKDNIKKQKYTLCSIVDATKLAHFSYEFTTDDANPSYTLDFSTPELKGYEEFDVMVLAEETSLGKLTILSAVYNSDGERADDDDDDDDDEGGNNSSVGFIVIIVILSLVIVAGGIAAFIFFRKVRSQGQVKSTVVAKATSLAEINGSPQEKLTQSQAVDP